MLGRDRAGSHLISTQVRSHGPQPPEHTNTEGQENVQLGIIQTGCNGWPSRLLTCSWHGKNIGGGEMRFSGGLY